MEKILASLAGQATGGYEVNQSLLLEEGNGSYLTRTPSVEGNRRTWTFSTWVKKATNGTHRIFRVGSNTFQTHLSFNASNQLEFFSYDDPSPFSNFKTTATFTDTSSWYHIVLKYDSTQGVASDRFKIYVNGVLYTDFFELNNPTLNLTTPWNSTSQHEIGRYVLSSSEHFDGYIAETHFTDGTAYDADAFGEFDEFGYWIPKRPSVAYGTNGFYLNYADGTAIGNDVKGSNNWTPVNLNSNDIYLDSPTDNYAVLNSASPLLRDIGNTLGYLSSLNKWQTAVTKQGVSSGKWYTEVVPTHLDVYPANGRQMVVGITTDVNQGNTSSSSYIGQTATSYSWYYRGEKLNNSSNTSYGSSYTAGDVIGIALDLDAGTLTFYKNGVSQGVAFTGLSGTYYIGFSCWANNNTGAGVINYGQNSSFDDNKTRQFNTDSNGNGDFYYKPPTGYLALCQENL